MSGGQDGAGRRPTGMGRLTTGVVWAVLVSGLWMWGREVTDARDGVSAPTTGDVAAVGRPAGAQLPPPASPLKPARPQRLDIPSLDVQAPVVARGLDRDGAIEPPPLDQAAVVAWYGGGARPGAAGVALFVGHADTETRPAVFHGIGSLRAGDTVRVARDDGTVVRFTVEDVEVVPRDGFDAERAYGVRKPGRAELRLVTCAGTYDEEARGYTANVIVSAYLSGRET